MARVDLNTVAQGVCDGCGAKLPGWALYKPLRADEWKDAVCGACITAKANAAVTVAPVVIPPWESEQGKFLKAQRNLALDGSLWAVMPGSPLTVACQAKWAAYRASLNRMTVDCLDPAAWVWPETPKNEYPATSTASTTSATATGTVKLSGAK